VQQRLLLKLGSELLLLPLPLLQLQGTAAAAAAPAAAALKWASQEQSLLQYLPHLLLLLLAQNGMRDAGSYPHLPQLHLLQHHQQQHLRLHLLYLNLLE
jgi:hypothetical protein